MLTQPRHHEHPFPFFRFGEAFSKEACASLEGLFLVDCAWQQHDGAFYRCFLRDITAEVQRPFVHDVVNRMRMLTGIALLDRVQITAQRMIPGQAIGVHSDQPSLGHEFVRLVLQLNRDWNPGHGGVLELFDSPDGAPVSRFPPLYNHALGFQLHPGSHHAVTEVTQTRRTVVFNFWHPANTPHLAESVQALFADVHFSELPSSLHSLASLAETSLPEGTTLHAGMAAMALCRWGYDPTTVVAGYRYSTGLCGKEDLPEEVRAGVQLADWVAWLYRNPFDLIQWRSLRDDLDGMQPSGPAAPIWNLCLPDLGDVVSQAQGTTIP